MNKVIIFGAESAYFYFSDNLFRKSLYGSQKMLCDSFSLSLILKITRVPHKRLTGPDYMDHCLKQHNNQKIMVIGGNKKAHKNLKKKYNLKNSFFYDGILNSKKLDPFIVKKVLDFSPKIIFICLGIRKQEYIANMIWEKCINDKKLKNSIIVGTGAAVDFLGNTKIRSSIIWRKIGLEWFPRLIREPRIGPRLLRSLLGCFIILFRYKELSKDSLFFVESF